jgi:hypothetical protein
MAANRIQAAGHFSAGAGRSFTGFSSVLSVYFTLYLTQDYF